MASSFAPPLGVPTEHELRTALAMIVGYAELLRTRDDPAIQAEAPERILAAAERLSQTIDRLGTEERLAPAEPATPANVSPLASAARVGAAGHAPDFRIVIASDDPTVIDQVRAALPPESFEVVRVEPAVDARELLEGGHSDLAIVDWTSVGAGAARLVRDLHARVPQMPVLVLLSEHPSESAPPVSADAVLARPVTNLHLLAKAYELVSSQTARAAAG